MLNRVYSSCLVPRGQKSLRTTVLFHFLFQHWQIPLGRRFRALKLWMTLRSYGLKGLQAYLRKHISLAKKFADLVEQDDRFELVCPPSMGLVCFRLKGDNDLNKAVYDRIIARKVIYIVKGSFQDRLFMRFAICSSQTEESDVQLGWNEIRTATEEVLRGKSLGPAGKVMGGAQAIAGTESSGPADQVLGEIQPVARAESLGPVDELMGDVQAIAGGKNSGPVETVLNSDTPQEVRSEDTPLGGVLGEESSGGCGQQKLTPPVAKPLTVQ
ncbi:alpha-methyldopa hypersensitive protein-like [Diaphorina citri]|uniref:Alpha-methyldopa hypersensitive protein-like n=1 Tax=Diaphorina citri TaxID=121845 RepID=A0A1S4EQD9_DIACI|nr:alpha-methyldopa hypersensitive protein-like [Diaphorina citri]